MSTESKHFSNTYCNWGLCDLQFDIILWCPHQCLLFVVGRVTHLLTSTCWPGHTPPSHPPVGRVTHLLTSTCWPGHTPPHIHLLAGSHTSSHPPDVIHFFNNTKATQTTLLVFTHLQMETEADGSYFIECLERHFFVYCETGVRYSLMLILAQF